MATSRPATPDSPSSLRDATATIDELTLALSNYSRVPSPEPPHVSTCCCGREDCETTRAWTAYKGKLENRLVLSAEVGQALLERHEAYVRRHEISNSNDFTSPAIQSSDIKRTEEQVEARVAELLRENAVLDKRLSQALVNHEIADVSHQDALEQLKRAEEKVAQLSAHNARLVGTQTRLDSALREKDDIQQERDSAIQRARMAEARTVSLKEKCSKLQSEASRLREVLEMQRSQRNDSSEEILADARSRIQQIHQFYTGRSVTGEDDDVTKVLQSLVADNQVLKNDNTELQNMLDATREDLRALQEELEERRASDIDYTGYHNDNTVRSTTYRNTRSPISPTFNFGTAPIPSAMHSVFHPGPSTPKRSRSAERGFRRNAEPLTPETNRRPLSPTELLIPSQARRNSAGQQRSRYTPSHLSIQIEDHIDSDFSSPEKSRAQQSLLSLTRSRAVQTDGTGLDILAPSPLPHTYGDHSHDGHSEASSLDSNPSVVGVIVERTAQLLNRLIQADALTLTNRLKRQRLLGADISHLSRNTVSGILNESNNLRAQFRAFLEDDKVITMCTRRDLRALFKLFKDMFGEMGQLRVTLNDVILDPTVASKVSDMALHPTKANTASGESSSNASSAGPGWIAPLSKFLGLPGGSGQDDAASRALSPPVRPVASRGRPPPRIVPKREAALSASTTTVNVDFSSGGLGRAVASAAAEPVSVLPVDSSSNQLSTISSDSSRSVMDIFAGAPRAVDQLDPWVVVSKPQRGALGGRRFDIVGGGTIGRSTLRRTAMANVSGSSSGGGLSRVVDAMLDSQTSPSQDEDGRDRVPDTLLERTLRPRGLSDSSIHTTFMSHGTEEQQSHASGDALSSQLERPSVLQTLSRKVQNFRFASSSFIPSRPVGAPTTQVEAAEAVPSMSRPQTPANSNPVARPGIDTHRSPTAHRIRDVPERSASAGGLFPSLNVSSWSAALPPDIADLEPEDSYHPPGFYVSRHRDEASSSRTWVRGREA